MKRRRYLTLIEIMVVIVLIGLIGGVVAYNVGGSLQEGKAFKTKQGALQIGNILMLEVASSPAGLATLQNNWQDTLASSPLVKRGGKDLLADGWGGEYTVTVVDDQLQITSQAYTTWYTKKHPDHDDPDALILY